MRELIAHDSMVNHPTECNNEDALSMQILSVQTTGSLRTHKHQSTEDIYPNWKDHCINGNSTERQSIEKTSQNVSLPPTDSSRSKIPVASVAPLGVVLNNENVKTCVNIDSSTWPGQKLMPGDPDYILFTDTDKYLQTKCSLAKKKLADDNNTNSKHKRTSKCDKNLNKEAKKELSCPIQNSCSGVVDDNIPELEIPDDPEKDDYLLQCEMKNWETIIRDSSSYNKKVDETTSLISARCVDDAMGTDYLLAQS